MQAFMNQNFLLKSDAAKKLYFEYAQHMPVVDYHCHIDPQELYENKHYADMAELWLGTDHYKWRLMRVCGVDERYITGDATGWEKFYAFAEILPQAVGSPVFHWAYLELRRYFGCDAILNKDTAKEVWDFCNEKLKTDPSLRARGILEHSKVNILITTDDPIDSLEWHEKLKSDESFRCTVRPAFRPDNVLAVESPAFSDYVAKLSAAAQINIRSFADLKAALVRRLDHFNACGCRTSDHSTNGLACLPATEQEIDAILQQGLSGQVPSAEDSKKYLYAVMRFLGEEYHKRGWSMELHFSVLRNVNTRCYETLGINSGFDIINPSGSVSGIESFLDELDKNDVLPNTLLFSLNPNDNAVINTLAGSFCQAGVPGKVQQGSAWWFNDNIVGMVQQMTSFANLNALGNFLGMLTDSRCLLSYARHEYFRRIFCNLLGEYVQNGEYPADYETLGQITENVCYNNVLRFFGY